MKKIVTIVCAMVLSASACIANNSNSESITYTIAEDSPQACQPSLTHYRGTVGNTGYTELFRVGLNCPQDSDVYVTVYVYVDNSQVTSSIVKIPANKIYSDQTCFRLADYIGKSYRLDVK